MKTKMKKAILILFFLSVGLVPIILAPAPTAQTLSATSVTQTSAILRGKVNPNGLSTKVDFCSCDPSASPSYFSPTPLQNIGSGNADVTVTHTLTGLTPATTYKYCVRSTNSAGSQNGACVSFTTTSGGAPTAQTLSATSVTQTSAILRGKVNPNGLSTKVDFCSCDPSASPSYFSPTPLQNIGSGNADVTVTYTLSGLTPATTYKYCVRSTNSAGSQNGACVSFTTSGGAPSATVSTNKPDYALGETVVFYLTNTGSVAITGTINNPWTIYKKVGATWQIAYVPGIAMQNWTLTPGDSKTWSWGQTSNAMVTIDAGEYKVTVDISGVGTWSTTFTIGMGGGGAGTGSLKIFCNTSDYDIYIDGLYVATAMTSTVTLPDISAGVHQVRLTKPGCQDEVESVTILSGMTTTIHVNMVCDGGEPSEEDDDGDGVPNDEDSCYNPDCTRVDNNGCPKDTDNDGLNDCEDDCPTQRGIAANDGCPAEEEDKDGDGVSDDQDACYNPECSIVDANGCPRDTDGDGLDDCKDECPHEYGERQDEGCPTQDADNDGVPDDQDNCYNPGCTRVDSRGCPWDSDNDGLNDCEDNCPNQSGPRSNYGCPEPGPSFCLGTGLLAILVMIGGIFGGMQKKKRK